MNFCTMLSKRYAKHLQKSQSAYLKNSSCQILVRCSTSVDRFSNSIENDEEADSKEEQWDDFSDKSIKQAFEGVLFYKHIAKQQASKAAGTASEELSNLNTDMVSYLYSQCFSGFAFVLSVICRIFNMSKLTFLPKHCLQRFHNSALESLYSVFQFL